jgi:undecaprenyl-diphosphatase
MLTELSHLVTHRPRPFVYQNPAVRGTEAAHYTSFYSGHTSFVAAMSMGLLLCLFRRMAPTAALPFWAAAGQALMLATAINRIFAGRHFASDVIAGAVAGALVAVFVAYRRAPAAPSSPASA